MTADIDSYVLPEVWDHNNNNCEILVSDLPDFIYFNSTERKFYLDYDKITTAEIGEHEI